MKTLNITCDMNQPEADRMNTIATALCAQCESSSMSCEVSEETMMTASMACCDMRVECVRTSPNCFQMRLELPEVAMSGCMAMALAGYICCMMCRELECETSAKEMLPTS